MSKCPLFSLQDHAGVACLEADCAWWDQPSKRCYVAWLPEIGNIPGEVGIELKGVIGAIEDLGRKLPK